ncbi:MAG: methyltransferase, partial [Flavobacterium sp.]|nr:methyltransferase [Pedobacter sp.]
MITKQNDIFFFKRFSVDQRGCAMKVNTDGVLLGALAETDKSSRILDIGTGTGVISLMLAQRFPKAKIDAVEIDKEAALMAGTNFKNSAFSLQLQIFHSSYKEYFKKFPNKKYDLIVSNPPFFINSQQSKDLSKTIAKHTNQIF